VNRPLNEVKTYHRAGALRIDGNGGAAPNYHPNSFDQIVESRDTTPGYSNVDAVARYNHRENPDYYLQAGDLYRLMSEAQKKILVSNIAAAMTGVPTFIQEKQVTHFFQADKDFGIRVADLLDVAVGISERKTA